MEIWEVGGRMVTMCCPAASHCVKARTVVVMWVLVVMVEPAAYWCACEWGRACAWGGGGGGGDWAEEGADAAEVADEPSEESESSWGDRWMTRSAHGL